MRELLKEEWPDRQWQARLYHWIRPRMLETPTGFDEIRTPDDGKQSPREI